MASSTKGTVWCRSIKQEKTIKCEINFSGGEESGCDGPVSSKVIIEGTNTGHNTASLKAWLMVGMKAKAVNVGKETGQAYSYMGVPKKSPK